MTRMIWSDNTNLTNIFREKLDISPRHSFPQNCCFFFDKSENICHIKEINHFTNEV